MNSNQTRGSKSMGPGGRQSAQGGSVKQGSTGNSFAPPRASGQISQGGSKSGNLVIDIESESLTYNQARSIRLQIQRDVEQLRNRVRMLQQEEQRAIKKINETRKKTAELQNLQRQNDELVIKKQREKQRIQMEKERDLQKVLSRQKKGNDEVRIRNDQYFRQKKQAVVEVRRQKDLIKQNLYQMRQEQAMTAEMRKNQIKKAQYDGYQKQNEFLKKKRDYARAGVNTEAHRLSNAIQNYQVEGDELEKLETELLAKLQATQKMEREAFMRLEDAMVNGSIPPPLRADASKGAASTNASKIQEGKSTGEKESQK